MFKAIQSLHFPFENDIILDINLCFKLIIYKKNIVNAVRQKEEMRPER